MLAVQEGRDDLAKQALVRYNEQPAGRPAAARDLGQAQGRDRSAQGVAAPAQRQDRRGQAQEEHPGGAGQAGRGAAADPGDDVGHVRQERLRVVRADGREDRGQRAQGDRGRRAAARSSRATTWSSSSRRWSTRGAPTSSCWSSRPRWGSWARAAVAANSSARAGRRCRMRSWSKTTSPASPRHLPEPAIGNGGGRGLQPPFDFSPAGVPYVRSDSFISHSLSACTGPASSFSPTGSSIRSAPRPPTR